MTRSLDRRGLGLALVAASAVAYSMAGFFTRLIPLDAWTILFWRGLFAGGFIAVVFLAQQGRHAPAGLRAIGRPGLVAAACSGLATVMFINAFRLTSVAEAVIILATAPFLTAAIDRLWLGIREQRATLAASVAALGGVCVMMADTAGRGHLIGDVLAFGVTALMALMMVIIRRHRETPMLPAASLSAFLCALIVWPLAAPLSVGATDIVELALFGVAQFGLGLLLLTLGTRFVSATESALVSTIEVPLAALWVWLAFAEVPKWSTLAGGVVVIAAVMGHILIGDKCVPACPEASGAQAERPITDMKGRVA